MEIKEITLIEGENIEDRKVIVKVEDRGMEYEVTIESCYESWQQYGAPKDVLYETMGIAEQYNNWLHGVEEEVF